MHVAVAAVHGVDYLLTWNCRHLDNAETKPVMRRIWALLKRVWVGVVAISGSARVVARSPGIGRQGNPRGRRRRRW